MDIDINPRMPCQGWRCIWQTAMSSLGRTQHHIANKQKLPRQCWIVHDS